MTLALALDLLNTDLSAWAASLGRTEEYILRLALAAAAGSLVGLEREVRGRLAGFRTNLLVCLGSALVMIVSISFAHMPWGSTNALEIRIDPARIAYGVMTGIGFLGAGTIIQSRGAIRGLTTAAALWCVAAIGLTMGLGLYLLGILGTIIVVVALWLLDYIEAVIPKTRFRRVVLRRAWSDGCVPATREKVKKIGFSVNTVTFERVGPGLNQVDITLSISFQKYAYLDALDKNIRQDDAIELLAVKE